MYVFSIFRPIDKNKTQTEECHNPIVNINKIRADPNSGPVCCSYLSHIKLKKYNNQKKLHTGKSMKKFKNIINYRIRADTDKLPVCCSYLSLI